MAYDAYAPDEESFGVGDLAKSVISAPFAPSTYLWTHLHMPGMWSTTKGIATPFNKRTKDAVGLIAGTFKSRGFGKGMNQIWAQKKYLNPWSGLLGMGRNKSQWVGGATMAKIPELQKELAEAISKKGSFTAGATRANYGRVQGTRLRNIRDAAIKKRAAGMYAVAEDNISAIAATNRYDKFRRGAKAARQRFRKLESNLVIKSAENSNKVLGLKSLLFRANTIKWGVRVGKAASIVGAATLAWDLTQMVAQPIGSALISSASNAITAWNDRFMPQMGGQLAMSYMSQGAATERQRAVQAMGRSQINGRSAFGQEAAYMHQ